MQPGVDRPSGLALVLLAIPGLGLDQKSFRPVTTTMAALSAIPFLDLVSGSARFNLVDWCFSPNAVVKHKEYYRIFSAPFFHQSDAHFYWSVSSLLSEGSALETKLGSTRFTATTVVLLTLSSAIHTLLAYASKQTGNLRPFFLASWGFRNLVLAFRTLSIGQNRGYTCAPFIPNTDPPRIQGIPFSGNQTLLGQLALSVLLCSPNFSVETVIDPLSGILAGVLFVYLNMGEGIEKLIKVFGSLNKPSSGGPPSSFYRAPGRPENN